MFALGTGMARVARPVGWGTSDTAGMSKFRRRIRHGRKTGCPIFAQIRSACFVVAKHGGLATTDRSSVFSDVSVPTAVRHCGSYQEYVASEVTAGVPICSVMSRWEIN